MKAASRFYLIMEKKNRTTPLLDLKGFYYQTLRSFLSILRDCLQPPPNLCTSGLNYKRLTSCISSAHASVWLWIYFTAVLSRLTLPCLCPLRFDYCRFIELDYVPMEAGYMVSMRPTKGYTSTKSPTKGYNSTKSPDRHSHSVNSPSTPRSRLVLSTVVLHVNKSLNCIIIGTT